MHLPKVFNSFN